ncbi:MAG: hypothetical protein QM817_06760 [Archangium sp.]
MLRRLPTILILLSSAVALAQSKPTLIDAPLDVRVPMSKANSEKLQTDFRQLLARKSGTLTPTSSNWKAAVAALKRQDCDVRDECLRQLAINGSSLYALFASVERNAAGTELTAIGRVVNQDGTLVREPVRMTVSAASKSAPLDALTQLIAALKLEELPLTLTPPVAPTPAVVAQPQPQPQTDPTLLPPPPPPPSSNPNPPIETRQSGSGSGVRIGAYVALGVTIAAAASSIGFGVSAASQRATLPIDGHLLDEAQVATQQRVNSFAGISLGSGIGAGAALIATLILFSIPVDAPVTVAPSFSRDGAFATLTWRTP